MDRKQDPSLAMRVVPEPDQKTGGHVPLFFKVTVIVIASWTAALIYILNQI